MSGTATWNSCVATSGYSVDFLPGRIVGGPYRWRSNHSYCLNSQLWRDWWSWAEKSWRVAWKWRCWRFSGESSLQVLEFELMRKHSSGAEKLLKQMNVALLIFCHRHTICNCMFRLTRSECDKARLSNSYSSASVILLWCTGSVTTTTTTVLRILWSRVGLSFGEATYSRREHIKGCTYLTLIGPVWARVLLPWLNTVWDAKGRKTLFKNHICIYHDALLPDQTKWQQLQGQSTFRVFARCFQNPLPTNKSSLCKQWVLKLWAIGVIARYAKLSVAHLLFPCLLQLQS